MNIGWLFDQIPGTWVEVGGKDFLDTKTSDPAFAAKYLDLTG